MDHRLEPKFGEELVRGGSCGGQDGQAQAPLDLGDRWQRGHLDACGKDNRVGSRQIERTADGDQVCWI